MIKKIKNSTDNRWFIWTIVFLLVSGVSLVSYIMITNITETDALDTTYATTMHK